MMRWIEAILFLSLAGAIHAGVWAVSPVTTGTASSGGGGTQEVSVRAATPAQAAMIALWQRPPVAVDRVPELQPADRVPAPEAGLDMPTAADGLRPRISAPPPQPTKLPLSQPDAMPRADTAPATPPMPKADRAPSTRPEMRPVTIGQPAPAQPERRAKGPSGQAQTGVEGSDRLQSASNNRHQALRARWGSEIHAKIQRNLRYPKGASRAGTAKLALTVAPNGTLQALSLVRSSGDALLDKAAIHAVKRAGRFAKAPPELSDAAYAFSLSLTFRR